MHPRYVPDEDGSVGSDLCETLSEEGREGGSVLGWRGEGEGGCCS